MTPVCLFGLQVVVDAVQLKFRLNLAFQKSYNIGLGLLFAVLSFHVATQYILQIFYTEDRYDWAAGPVVPVIDFSLIVIVGTV